MVKSTALIFYHVGVEDLAEALPASKVKSPAIIQTPDRAVSHIQSVVCVVMHKQTLTPEGDQSIDLPEPLVDLAEVCFVTLAVNGVGVFGKNRV